MFIYTTRLSKIKILISLILIAAILITAAVIISRKRAAAATLADNSAIRTNEDRIAFLNRYGWEVKESPLSEQTVLIPKTFSSVYEEYNKLQLEQGCDLTDYSGLEVSRYTYQVTNYPDYTGDVIAELLVYNNCIIGGDIHATAMDGFMHGISHDFGKNT